MVSGKKFNYPCVLGTRTHSTEKKKTLLHFWKIKTWLSSSLLVENSIHFSERLTIFLARNLFHSRTNRTKRIRRTKETTKVRTNGTIETSWCKGTKKHLRGGPFFADFTMDLQRKKNTHRNFSTTLRPASRRAKKKRNPELQHWTTDGSAAFSRNNPRTHTMHVHPPASASLYWNETHKTETGWNWRRTENKRNERKANTRNARGPKNPTTNCATPSTRPDRAGQGHVHSFYIATATATSWERTRRSRRESGKETHKNSLSNDPPVAGRGRAREQQLSLSDSFVRMLWEGRGQG